MGDDKADPNKTFTDDPTKSTKKDDVELSEKELEKATGGWNLAQNKKIA